MSKTLLFQAFPALLVAVAACNEGSTAETLSTPRKDAGIAEMVSDCSEVEQEVAASAGELNAWLQRRKYRCWAGESEIHRSDGPHGGNVRVFLNETLDRSLAAGGSEHPAGSVAVKELYGSGTTDVTGWAVGVKTQDASGQGEGWYWYEVFSAEPGASGAIEGQGKALCSSCHAGGRDFVLITHPLR